VHFQPQEAAAFRVAAACSLDNGELRTVLVSNSLSVNHMLSAFCVVLDSHHRGGYISSIASESIQVCLLAESATAEAATLNQTPAGVLGSSALHTGACEGRWRLCSTLRRCAYRCRCHCRLLVWPSSRSCHWRATVWIWVTLLLGRLLKQWYALETTHLCQPTFS